jgi:hypothetical protein
VAGARAAVVVVQGSGVPGAGGAGAAYGARPDGPELGEEVEIVVRDSSTEVRRPVLPERPAGAEDLSEEERMARVSAP